MSCSFSIVPFDIGYNMYFMTVQSSGSYCPAGTRYHNEFKCPLGTYSNSTGLNESSQCSPCAGGFYCGEMGLTEATTPCAAGWVQASITVLGSGRASIDVLRPICSWEGDEKFHVQCVCVCVCGGGGGVLTSTMEKWGSLKPPNPPCAAKWVHPPFTLLKGGRTWL